MTTDNKKDSAANEAIITFKGFDNNLRCRDFQFAVGQTYIHEGEVKACAGGFHACEYPLDVFRYYAPGESRYAIVEQSGDLSRHDEDSKVASRSIAVKAEIGFADLVKASIGLTSVRAKASTDDKDSRAASGNCSNLAASGYDSNLAASGYDSKLAASGDHSKLAASGYCSKLAASGNCSNLAASGDHSNLAASGDHSKLAASGNYSNLAASGNYSNLAASGDHSKLAASGYCSNLAASGYCSKLAASGRNSVIACAAAGCRFKAAEGGAIAAAYHDGERNRFAVAYVGENGIKADTWYTLNADGEFVEAE